VGVGVGVADGAAIEKLVSEISKKILPTPSILIRPTEVGVLGIRTDWLPSLGVLASRVVGNVLPPSVEREILTFAALTGAAVVFATFQVTVKFAPPGRVVAVFGAVTAKGPEVLVTVRVDEVELMPPPLARLSRATTWKTIVREIDGSNSPVRHAVVGHDPLVLGGTLALLKMY